MLVFAAIALTLTVWSRPTVALMCVAVFPLFIEFIFKIRKDTLKDGILTVASFALPLMAGAIAVMWYNNARFGSPLDFGANYQLTVSDVSLNTIDFKYLFSSFFSYFLCPMWQTEAKPSLKCRELWCSRAIRDTFTMTDTAEFLHTVCRSVFSRIPDLL
jgi:hypothetical protein